MKPTTFIFNNDLVINFGSVDGDNITVKYTHVVVKETN